MIRIREICGCVKTFTCIGIRKNTRNTDDSFGSGTKLLLPSWLLSFQHEERETQFLLCWLFHLTQQCAGIPKSTGLASPSPKINPLRPASDHNSSGLPGSESESQLTAFFKIPKNPSPSFPGMTSFTSTVLFPIQGFYYDICDCHILPTQAWTPALNVCP